MDDGQARGSAPKPQWWKRRRREADDWLLPDPSEPTPQVPLHAPDPYATPPYGRPGPWAPAPPVQLPAVTPPGGTPVPPPPASEAFTPAPPAAAALPTPAGAEPQAGTEPQAPTAAPPPAGSPAPQAGGEPVDAAAPAGPPAEVASPAGGAPAPYAGGEPAGAAAPVGAPVGAQPHPLAAPPLPGAVPAYPAAPAAGAAAPVPPSPWAYDPWAVRRQQAAAKAPRRGQIVAGAVVVALVAGGVGGGVGAWLERDGGGVRLAQAAAGGSDRDPGSVAGIAARALPGVVTIHVRGSGEQGTGTGFVLDKSGHILTNNHVVRPAAADGSISVTFNDGHTAKATLVGRDSGYDLAVIKVTGVSRLTPLPLGNSDSVRVGDSVVAIGAPFDLAGTVTTGIISAKARPITAGGRKAQDGGGSDISYVDALQTDAPINPGNSGGPLMDAQARVIGINSAIRSAGGSDSGSGGQGGSIGLGFAIPVNQAKRVAEELINTGRATHPVIGVSLDMAYTGDGARVNTDVKSGGAVTSGGPADKAGVRPGDVIRTIDGVAVHSGQELIVKVRSHRPGETLTLTLERDGKESTVRLTLGSAGDQ
ncbi:hypothetical protein GCM10010218_57780 [Streptomyces mashuensis]|uniref:PDZ domain-containing protein n=1 Tax=Streptomyces mashuensis TaxID=33904 RepID=A0A919B9Q4_9ACTN|nr:trypsin-like peptidase domain-containing protein [Streptomyces mashuensis]GHF68774.1 hypothetical protein GCM10010218_57780 [Streptomyces mashuensis]